jgi:hypothetical protein
MTSGGFFFARKRYPMIIIRNAEDLASALANEHPAGLRPILERYQPLVVDEPLAVLFIIQARDTAASLEQCRGRPFELWEFIGVEAGWYEAVFVLCDDGSGHVVLIPDCPDIDPDLVSLCGAHAVPNS